MAFDLKKDGIKILNDGKFLYATMPNGDVIPCQVETILKQGVDNKDNIMCEITLKASIALKDFEIVNKIQTDEPDKQI